MKLLNDIVFQIGSNTFGGFKLDKNIKYPWNNDTEFGNYYENLLKDKNNYNKQKIKDLLHLDFDENLHIKISIMLMFEILSYITFIFGGVFMIIDLRYVSISFTIVSLIFILLRCIYMKIIKTLTLNLDIKSINILMIIKSLLIRSIINIVPCYELLDYLINLNFEKII